MLQKEKAKKRLYTKVLALILSGILFLDIQSFSVQAFMGPILSKEKINRELTAEQGNGDLNDTGLSAATDSDSRPEEKPEAVKETKKVADEQQLRDSIEKAKKGSGLELVLINNIQLSEGSSPISVPSGVSVSFKSEDGSNYLIERSDAGRHFSIQTAKDVSLEFDNIIIDGANHGGGISVNDSNDILLSNVVIQNCADSLYGGALSVENSESVVVREAEIKDNSSKVKGGGIYVEASHVELNDVEVLGNVAAAEAVYKHAYGGGIYAGDNSYVKITGTAVIRGNNAKSTYYNTGSFHGYGGGLYIAAKGKVDFNGNVIFSENVAGSYGDESNGVGGAIHSDAAELIITESVIIKNNKAKIFGGGVSGGAGTKIIVNGAHIEDNIVSYEKDSIAPTSAGGGIYIAKDSKLILNQAIVEGNRSGATGGGIQAARDTIIEIHGGSVSKNIADRKGGGIYSAYSISNSGITEASKVLIDQNAKINQNTAGDTSGAVYAFELTLNSGEINENVVEDGFSNIHVHKMFINGGSIHNNRVKTARKGAEIPGAGILCSIFRMTDGEISNNTYENVEPENASVFGGGVSFEHFKDMSYGVEMTGGIIRGNQATYGGGIANGYNGENNSFDNFIKISGGTISENVAVYGGGIMSFGTPLTISGSAEIINNTAEKAGGGVYQSNGLLDLSGNVLVSGNRAAAGGGVYLDQTIRALLKGQVKIIDNTAATDGGGIWTNDLSKLAIPSEKVIFADNKAAEGYLLSGEEDIKMHDEYVKTKAFTVPFQYGYNNYDINFKSTGLLEPYTVEYYMNDENNSLIGKELHFKGELLTTPETPVRSGYEFTGWFLTANGEDMWDFSQNRVESDMKLFAGWKEAKKADVTITYHYNYEGHGVYHEQIMNRNDLIQLPENPNREGYRFTGWFMEPQCTSTWDFTIGSAEERLNLYAGWEKCEDPNTEKYEYPVTYLYNYPGKGIYLEQKAVKGSKLTPPAVPQRNGYQFTNWYLDAACTTSWNFTSDTVEDCLVLYAGWNKNTGGSGGSGGNGGGGGVIVKPVTPPTKGPGSSGGSGKPEGTEPAATKPPVEGTTSAGGDSSTGSSQGSTDKTGNPESGKQKPDSKVNKVPKTGDNIFAPISILIILCVASLITVLYSKKRKNIK